MTRFSQGLKIRESVRASLRARLDMVDFGRDLIALRIGTFAERRDRELLLTKDLPEFRLIEVVLILDLAVHLRSALLAIPMSSRRFFASGA